MGATTLLARGLLMLSLLLMLMPTTMDIPPMDTDPMLPTPTTDLMDTTLLARGLLMLSPLLMPTTTDMPPLCLQILWCLPLQSRILRILVNYPFQPKIFQAQGMKTNCHNQQQKI